MITNYFTSAWRNIRRNKAYAVINIIGLAVGNSGMFGPVYRNQVMN
jgi:hypothetical protein